MGGTSYRQWPADSLLGRTHDRIRQALLGLGTPVRYRSRQTVIRQGEEGLFTVLLLSGCVKVVVNTEFGQDVLLAVRGAGDLCGEMAVLEARRRSANVIACVPVHARLIHSKQLVDFLEHTPEAGVALARAVSERLRWANDRRAEFVACPAPIRVARVVIEINRKHGHSPVPLSQAEIASLAGVAPRTAEKALQTMQRAGLVHRSYRRTVVTDMERLRRFAEISAEIPY
ncbi:Crp/Fnr family transcriptional regulator [Kutzneria albida]|uniref:Crp/Fnr family transcriptional regulator n=1 Tax=Kutzneria albida DSM 43870 TaxID=1449976 RepID=W5WJH1_9PSEU|nr:Crp/Fnr family transcriptional regulator [Kutzneria albida]AHI01023.1 hypothetical protein KALB_7665 [Kutzneria albida DSM 43870]